MAQVLQDIAEMAISFETFRGYSLPSFEDQPDNNLQQPNPQQQSTLQKQTAHERNTANTT